MIYIKAHSLPIQKISDSQEKENAEKIIIWNK